MTGVQTCALPICFPVTIEVLSVFAIKSAVMVTCGVEVVVMFVLPLYEVKVMSGMMVSIGVGNLYFTVTGVPLAYSDARNALSSATVECIAHILR